MTPRLQHESELYTLLLVHFWSQRVAKYMVIWVEVCADNHASYKIRCYTSTTAVHPTFILKYKKCVTVEIVKRLKTYLNDDDHTLHEFKKTSACSRPVINK
jgi:hypothetical protein